MLEGGYKSLFHPVIMSPPKRGLNKSGMTNGPLLQIYFDLITADKNIMKHAAFQTENC